MPELVCRYSWYNLLRQRKSHNFCNNKLYY